jgi:hypothetical protein
MRLEYSADYFLLFTTDLPEEEYRLWCVLFLAIDFLEV